MTSKCPANNCTWTMSSLKGHITWGEGGKRKGESFTWVVCCSNKSHLLPRLQQSWCSSRGICNAAHAGEKQPFKYPEGKQSSLSHRGDTIQQCGLEKTKNRSYWKFQQQHRQWGSLKKQNKNTSTCLGLLRKFKIDKRKRGPRLHDKCLKRRVRMRAESTAHSLHWVTLQHETAEHLTDVYLVTQWKLTPLQDTGGIQGKNTGKVPL